MSAQNPETHKELKGMYANVLKRLPTDLEMDDLMEALDHAGVRYGDPLLQWMMQQQRILVSLEALFAKHYQTGAAQLKEAREAAVKLADRELAAKRTESVKAAAQEMEAERAKTEAAWKATQQLHLSGLKAAVREELKGKFDATWTKEWTDLQEMFKADWEKQIKTRAEHLSILLDNADKKIRWLLYALGALLLMLLIAVVQLDVMAWQDRAARQEREQEQKVESAKPTAAPGPGKTQPPGNRK